MTGPTQHWVGRDAAFNGRELERQHSEVYSIPIDTDHSGLVKCDKEDTFKTISHVLESLDWKVAKDGVESSKTQGFKDGPVVDVADATYLSLPSDLKLTLIGGPLVQVYPVLRFGQYMYWPVSFNDNRVGTSLVITDLELNNVGRLDVLGSRYVHQIVVARDRKVHFIGQGDQIITLSWEMLSAAVGIPEWFGREPHSSKKA